MEVRWRCSGGAVEVRWRCGGGAAARGGEVHPLWVRPRGWGMSERELCQRTFCVISRMALRRSLAAFAGELAREIPREMGRSIPFRSARRPA